MSTQAADTSVRTSIVVEASISRAFEVFTEDFGSFKPREHNLLQVDIAETGWQGVRDGVAADRSWPLYLQRYADRMATER